MGMQKGAVRLLVEYEVKVFDPKTGKVIKRVRGRSKTFTQHFSRLLAIMMFPRGDATVSMSVTDYGGTARTMRAPTTVYAPPQYDPATGYRFNVGIGRSDVAFSRTHYNLLDLIDWVPYSTISYVDDGTKVVFEVSGSWYNDTGVTQTVKEIGMLGLFRDDAGVVRWIMLARDVITAVDVPADRTIAVAYSVTIPF